MKTNKTNKSKILALLLAAALMVGLLAGCGGTPVAVVGGNDDPATDAPTKAPDDGPGQTGGAVKTGLSFTASLGSSKPASAEGDGLAQTDVTLVAVTVDDAGVIDQCVIDMIQAKIGFDQSGKLTTPTDTTFQSKNELGDAYGMRVASAIGKEWNEQMEALAQYAQGKTVEELKTMAVNEEGKAGDADLAASCSLYIGGFVSAIEDAANQASHRGAQKGDKLQLVSVTSMASSKDANGVDADGLAQAYATAAAVTTNAGTVTSCYIDAMQANVNFDAAGAITTDLSTAPQTKNQLGDAYGMRVASAIGKEWNEQAQGFADYVTGKSLSEISSIAVNEKGAPADADLAASCTIGIGSFQSLMAKVG